MGKLRRLTRRWITLAEGRGSEGGSLWVAHLTWTRKREGTTAWWESVEHCEGVDGAAARDPCDMAKLRREALCRIPDAVGENSEGRS